MYSPPKMDYAASPQVVVAQSTSLPHSTSLRWDYRLRPLVVAVVVGQPTSASQYSMPPTRIVAAVASVAGEY